MGQQKRWRAAQRNNFALDHGYRAFTTTPLGGGQLRRRAMLLAQRAMNDVKTRRIERLREEARLAAHRTIEEAQAKLRETSGVTEAQIAKKPRKVGTRKKAVEGV